MPRINIENFLNLILLANLVVLTLLIMPIILGYLFFKDAEDKNSQVPLVVMAIGVHITILGQIGYIIFLLYFMGLLKV